MHVGAPDPRLPLAVHAAHVLLIEKWLFMYTTARELHSKHQQHLAVLRLVTESIMYHRLVPLTLARVRPLLLPRFTPPDVCVPRQIHFKRTHGYM